MLSRKALARVALGTAAILAASSAAAVGLGPLVLQGVIDGPREGFSLELYNPYPEATDFVLYPVGLDDETAQDRVAILPAEVQLGSQRNRRILVVATALAAGETYKFRVCAQRKTPPEGVMINARVCSKITARRVG
ncbi:hypothetical protein HL653_06535 [Sphingomonas sp. AP4-R1]|uniref:hypothetical protein n=1 Tax=Sphingomonas sp. AP4-R1 TaxID=2735134 RepID=UPI001493CF49|nr:hypothetical protein [Sphingomonas sp. AP4-R1]QJU57493.1 hypothetical protein HL653_06535 [Sphingomonas sp. AP4-R1]